MLDLKAKLAKDIFEVPKMAATRDGFGKALMQLGESNKDVVVVCADLAESTRVLEFKDKYPTRYIEAGVAEQNMATVASGLANYGKIPFIASYATFSPGRNNEQIRTTISLNNVPVKIAGMHAGISVGPDGGTHQALEDLSLMRVQPNMVVISPCDSEEARKATLAAAGTKGPVYIRFGREKTPIVTSDKTPFEIGKVITLWKGKKPEVAIFATGPLLHNALLAARVLEGKIDTVVVNVHTIKPLDPAIIKIAKAAGAVVTVEEHQVMGGLGSAIAELLAAKCAVPIEFVGVHDRFGQSGEPKELIEHYGMSVTTIVDKIRAAKRRRV